MLVQVKARRSGPSLSSKRDGLPAASRNLKSLIPGGGTRLKQRDTQKGIAGLDLGPTGMRRRVLGVDACDMCSLWPAGLGRLWPTVEQTRVLSVNAPRSEAGWRWALQGWWVSCLSSLAVAVSAAFAAVADCPGAVAAAVADGAIPSWWSKVEGRRGLGPGSTCADGRLKQERQVSGRAG